MDIRGPGVELKENGTHLSIIPTEINVGPFNEVIVFTCECAEVGQFERWKVELTEGDTNCTSRDYIEVIEDDYLILHSHLDLDDGTGLETQSNWTRYHGRVEEVIYSKNGAGVELQKPYRILSAGHKVDHPESLLVLKANLTHTGQYRFQSGGGDVVTCYDVVVVKDPEMTFTAEARGLKEYVTRYVDFGDEEMARINIHRRNEYADSFGIKKKGQIITLDCTVDGVRNPVYYWEHNGKKCDSPPDQGAFPIGQGPIWKINVTGWADTGKYKCIVRDLESTKTKSRLYQIVSPEIPQKTDPPPPKVVNAALGKPVELHCDIPMVSYGHQQVLTFPWDSYEWSFKSVHNILKANSSNNIVLSGEHLTINNLTKEAVGKYACRARLGFGAVTPYYVEFSVKVNAPSQVSDALLTEQYLVIGNDKRKNVIRCPVTGGEPPSKHSSWYKDGVLLETPPRYSRYSTSGDTLRIARVDENDAGEYRCLPSNGVPGSNMSKAIDVQVLGGTKFTRPNMDEEYSFYSSIGTVDIPRCNAYGIPTPKTRLKLYTTEYRPSSISAVTLKNPRKDPSDTIRNEGWNRFDCGLADGPGGMISYQSGKIRFPEKYQSLEMKNFNMYVRKGDEEEETPEKKVPIKLKWIVEARECVTHLYSVRYIMMIGLELTESLISKVESNYDGTVTHTSVILLDPRLKSQIMRGMSFNDGAQTSYDAGLLQELTGKMPDVGTEIPLKYVHVDDDFDEDGIPDDEDDDVDAMSIMHDTVG